MRTIHTVLTGYLAGKSREGFIKEFPHAAGFINRTYDWLGPASELTDVQRLMMERMFLTIEYFSKTSDTVPCSQFDDISKLQEGERQVKELFGEDGRGASLDAEISEKTDLPKIHPLWTSEFQENLEKLEEPRKKDLYKTCGHIASGVHTLSDCHHSTFRYIESWIHGIGTGKLDIPTRREGTERERLGRLLFGYVLGLDKWLLGLPMQFLLLNLGHIDLGFDPKNEILRVYAYLGEERTPVKEWLAACLWHNLTYCPIAGNPGGLVRHKNLLESAKEMGVSVRKWIESVLENHPGNDN